MEGEDRAVESFASFASLLEDPLLLVSRGGAILWANEACARLLSRPAAGLVHRPLDQLVADAPEAIEALLRTAGRSSRFLPGTLTPTDAAGHPIVCRCDGARFGGPPQAPLIALRLAPREQASSEFLALRDKVRELSAEIGARKKAEEAARRWGERYRVTLESIGDAVIATDRTGRVTFMNAVAERLTGWPSAEAAGRHLDEVFVILNEVTREPVESPVAKVLRIGDVVGLANHTVLVRRDGSELPIDDSGAPIKAERGEVEGVVLVFRDLSERYALERELLAKTQRLEEADRRKNDYLSMLAHELRNPLAPIRNGVEILNRRADEATAGRVLQMMSRQLNHMVRLVDDLLDVSRVTHGKLELRTGEILLPDLIAMAVEMTQPLFEAAGVLLELEAVPPDTVLHGDRVRLVQLLANLLANAAKFSSKGQKVRLGARVDRAWLEIRVSDEGAGIRPDQLGDVFELFFQADQGLGRQAGGLGIGLTIARAIAALHGGSIHAASDGPGRGSTFTVRLPLPR